MKVKSANKLEHFEIVQQEFPERDFSLDAAWDWQFTYSEVIHLMKKAVENKRLRRKKE